MLSIFDQIGHEIILESQANRIVCLVPSITELLVSLGLEAKIVGRTKFCIFPKSLKKNVPQIGGTKQVHFDKVAALNPDLIICNKEENTEEIVRTLQATFPVYTSNIQTIHSALNMITDIGLLTGTSLEAGALVDKIEAKRISWHQRKRPERSALYLIWKKPYMTIGVDTYIHTMMQELNFKSALYDFRYPEITLASMQKLEPEYILLSSEPFPFRTKDMEELRQALPHSKVILVDGTYFSWYGSRILEAYEYFEQMEFQLLK